MTEPTELRTERLLLRPYTLADVDDVYAYAKDETWGRFLPVPVPYTYRDAEEYVARSVLTRPSVASPVLGSIAESCSQSSSLH